MKRDNGINKIDLLSTLTLVLFVAILSIIAAYSIVILAEPGVALICLLFLLLAPVCARTRFYAEISMGLGAVLLAASGAIFFEYRVFAFYFINPLAEAMSENLGALGFFLLLSAWVAIFVAMIDDLNDASLKRAMEKVSKHKRHRLLKLCALAALVLTLLLPIWPYYATTTRVNLAYTRTSVLNYTLNSTFNVSPYYELKTVCGQGSNKLNFTLALSSNKTFSVMIYQDVSGYASGLQNLRAVGYETYPVVIAAFLNNTLLDRLNVTKATISLPTDLDCVYLLTIVNQPTQLNMHVETASEVINSEAKATNYTYFNTTPYSNGYIWRGVETLVKVYHKAFSGAG